MKRVPLIVYLVIGAINVLGHLLDQPEMVKFSKPMLMPALIFFLYQHAAGRVTKTMLFVVIALIFSWLGDIALMQTEEMYFLLGLGSFLIAQVTYTYIYYRSTFQRPTFELMPLLPILTFTIFLLAFLLKNAPSDFHIPIGAYALCITAMACMARLRSGLTSNDSYQWVMMGSVLFVASDSMIAIDKFMRPIPYDGPLIMGTYIAAQLFIVMGILDHPE